mmetsp:Transcript_3284/g.7210  ORF Transcript_3284/g.7210 Transcript_3284/m.7210 type:complete len:908 (+) Transcript_3284:2731-5454(+)
MQGHLRGHVVGLERHRDDVGLRRVGVALTDAGGEERGCVGGDEPRAREQVQRQVPRVGHNRVAHIEGHLHLGARVAHRARQERHQGLPHFGARREVLVELKRPPPHALDRKVVGRGRLHDGQVGGGRDDGRGQVHVVGDPERDEVGAPRERRVVRHAAPADAWQDHPERALVDVTRRCRELRRLENLFRDAPARDREDFGFPGRGQGLDRAANLGEAQLRRVPVGEGEHVGGHGPSFDRLRERHHHLPCRFFCRRLSCRCCVGPGAVLRRGKFQPPRVEVLGEAREGDAALRRKVDGGREGHVQFVVLADERGGLLHQPHAEGCLPHEERVQVFLGGARQRIEVRGRSGRRVEHHLARGDGDTLVRRDQHIRRRARLHASDKRRGVLRREAERDGLAGRQDVGGARELDARRRRVALHSPASGRVAIKARRRGEVATRQACEGDDNADLERHVACEGEGQEVRCREEGGVLLDLFDDEARRAEEEGLRLVRRLVVDPRRAVEVHGHAGIHFHGRDVDAWEHGVPPAGGGGHRARAHLDIGRHHVRERCHDREGERRACRHLAVHEKRQLLGPQVPEASGLLGERARVAGLVIGGLRAEGAHEVGGTRARQSQLGGLRRDPRQARDLQERRHREVRRELDPEREGVGPLLGAVGDVGHGPIRVEGVRERLPHGRGLEGNGRHHVQRLRHARCYSIRGERVPAVHGAGGRRLPCHGRVHRDKDVGRRGLRRRRLVVRDGPREGGELPCRDLGGSDEHDRAGAAPLAREGVSGGGGDIDGAVGHRRQVEARDGDVRRGAHRDRRDQRDGQGVDATRPRRGLPDAREHEPGLEDLERRGIPRLRPLVAGGPHVPALLHLGHEQGGVAARGGASPFGDVHERGLVEDVGARPVAQRVRHCHRDRRDFARVQV